MKKSKFRNLIFRVLTIALIGISFQSLTESEKVLANEPNPGIIATFQNFYAPINGLDCPNGMATVSRPDNKPFVEFDNFSLTVNNSKNLVLGSSIYSTFATEDGKNQIELPVRICGNDTNYVGEAETYTLQIKYLSADRKFAQELSIPFTLIPVDEKARLAKQVREDCPSTGTGYDPYFVNWNIENSPKAGVGKTFTIAGTFYRFGYPADFEPLKVTRSNFRTGKDSIVARGITDINGKFKLSWKIQKGDSSMFNLFVEERIRPVGPFYGTFEAMASMPIFINCDRECKYQRMNQLNAPWEGKPAKSIGECAISKHEYSLVAPSAAISIAGSNEGDRNLWLKALRIVKNSVSDPSILKSRDTSAFIADPGSASRYSEIGSGGGTVWVSGHMRNGKYVRGYSRRKG